MNKKLILILTFMIFLIPSIANVSIGDPLEQSGIESPKQQLDTYLIRNEENYTKYGFSSDIFYKENGTTEFNKPIVISRDSLRQFTDGTLKLSDIQYSWSNKSKNLDIFLSRYTITKEVVSYNDNYYLINFKATGDKWATFSVKMDIEIKGIELSHSWWNSSYSSYKKITFDSSQVGSGLKNFPVFINLSSDTDLQVKCRADGNDIVFVKSDNSTILKYETELYNSTTGQLCAWVNMSKDFTGTETVYMYYGNSNGLDLSDSENTWDMYYMAVWHLNDTNWLDSTSNNIDLSPIQAPNIVSSNWGYGSNFDGTEELIHSTFFDTPPTDWTIEHHFKVTGDSNNEYFHISKKQTATSTSYIYLATRYKDIQNLIRLNSESDHYSSVGDMVKTNGWYYNGVTKNSSANQVGHFFYGTFPSVLSNSQNMESGTTTDFALCGYSPQMVGVLDEVRVSNIARSQDWIITTYNTLTNATNGSFFTISSEVAQPVSNQNYASNFSFTNGTMYYPCDIYNISMYMNNSASNLITYTVYIDSIGQFTGTVLNETRFMNFTDYLFINQNITIWVNMTDVSGTNSSWYYILTQNTFCEKGFEFAKMEIVFVIWLLLTALIIYNKLGLPLLPLGICYFSLSIYMISTYNEFQGFYFIAIVTTVFLFIILKLANKIK